MEFRHSTSEGEALAWLAELGEEARLLAGGTDAMMQHARGELVPAPSAFVHIGGIASLAGVEHDHVTRIGALTTHRFLGTDSAVGARHPALAEAAATVGGWQTQAVGTLGGNVCNASPAADTAPPLLVADAVLELASSSGRRRVPIEQFFVGRRRVDRRPDELVTAVELSPVGPRTGEAYLKVGRRGAMVVAVVGLAARLSFGDDGRIEEARLALCSVAPTPLRVRGVEEALVGLSGPEAAGEAGAVVAAEVAPIDDARATASYRRAVLAGLIERAVALCRSRAGLEEPR